MIDRLVACMHSPYYSPAVILARLCVNGGTAIWAVMVLSRPGALDPQRFPFYSYMIALMHEDLWAAGGLTAAIIGIHRLVNGAAPRWFGAIGYGMQALFWLYLAVTLFVDFPLPIPPATAASLVVMACLAVYGFVANARVEHGQHQ